MAVGFRVLEADELSDLLHEEIQRGLPAEQRVVIGHEL